MDAMKVQSSRFGTIELNDDEVINFPAGLIGFPDETSITKLVSSGKPISPAGKLMTSSSFSSIVPNLLLCTFMASIEWPPGVETIHLRKWLAGLVPPIGPPSAFQRNVIAAPSKGASA